MRAPPEREIALCNGGMLLGDGAVLMSLVAQLGNDNAKGEYYLTDVFALGRAAGHRAGIAEADPDAGHGGQLARRAGGRRSL